jgi:putative acetyltransferase
MTVTIRAARPADAAEIHRVHALAFGRQGEADLVAALVGAGCDTVSLVAVADDAVCGHVLLSPVRIASDVAEWAALGLAPLGVLPRCQRRGIGSRLVREVLAAAAALAEAVVVVLGEPAFYGRFGFEPARSHGLGCEYPGADDAFQVIELVPGALRGRSGLVRYRPEFARV